MAEIHVALGASIKNAIHAAQTGDVVVLAAGTHILDGHVVIPGGVTVTALPGATVDASGLTYGDAFYVYEDGVTISNFTLVGNGNTGANNGIRAQASATNEQLNGLVIEYMMVENFRRAEIDLNGAEGALLSNVTVDGRGSDGAGIALTDVTDVELQDISVANAKWGGVAIYSGNVFADRSNGAHDIRFTGTFDAPISADQPEPIVLQAKNGYPIADYTLPASYDYGVVDSARSEFRFFFDRSQDAVTYAQRAPATSVIYQNAAADGEAFSEGNIVVYPGMDLVAAYAAAKPGQVVHVIGTSDQDTHIGRGNAPDWFTGGADHDTFFGGAGAGDRFLYDTATADDVTHIQKIGQNVLITTNEGTDTLNGVEEIQFADGEVYSLSGTNIVAKAEADTSVATEDGPVVNGTILDNIQDLDGNFTISGVAAGTTPVTGNLGDAVEGAYGTLVLQADGSYTYTANLANSLADGETAKDVFTYTINDGGVLVHQTITVTVAGTNDIPEITSTDVTGSVFEAGDADAFVNAGLGTRPESGYEPSPAVQTLLSDILGTQTTAGAPVGAVLDAIEAELAPLGGTRADAILAIWDFLDTFYTSGAASDPYYHIGHNTAAIRLGIEYAAWLKAGNAPLTNAIVKYTEDVDGNPTRQQSVHDNLLGNFGEGSIDDRFTRSVKHPALPDNVEDTAIYAEIEAADLLALLNRPWISGNIPGNATDLANAAAVDRLLGLVPASSGQLTATDVDGDDLTWSIVGDDEGQYGTLLVDADGKWRYVIDQSKAQSLAEGASDEDVFTVQVSDGKGGAATTTVTITVNGSNDAPTVTAAIGDQTTAEDAAFSFDIPASAFADADDSATLTYTATLADGSPLPAWLSFDGTTFSGTPTNDNVGNISLKVTATDEFGASTSQTFNLAITNENDAPTFDFKQDFTGGSSGITSGSPYGNVTIVNSFTNSANEVITGNSDFAILTKAGSGPFTNFDGRRDTFVDGMTAEVKVYLDTGWATGEGFDYTVAANKQGGTHLRDFVFHVVKTTDGLFVGGDNNAVTTANLNPNPNGKTLIAESGWYTLQHVFSQTGGPNSALQVTMNLIDANGDIVFSVTRSNAADRIDTVVGGNRYAWFARLEVADGLAVDDYALMGIDSGSVVEGADSSVSLSGQVLFNDIDGDGFDNDSLTFAPADGQPEIGTFTATVSEDALGASGGTITWNFDAEESEIDYLAEGQTLELKFDVTIDDGKGGTATKTITITITGTNDGPVAQDTTILADEDGAILSGSVVATDADGNAVLSYSLTGPAPDGLTFNPDGTYSFDPSHSAYQDLAAGEEREIVVTYEVTDDHGAKDNGTLTIKVTGTNDIPEITSTDVTGGVFEAGDLDSASDETPSQDFSVDYILPQAILDDLATLTTASAADIPILLADIVAELPQGSIQDAFAIVFNTLDDFYDDGVNYSHVAHNTSALRLGMAYAEYLQGGGRPLDDVIVKAAGNRSQSLHDNLLGNFGLDSLADRFPGDTYSTDPGTLTGIYLEIYNAGCPSSGFLGQPAA